MDEVLYRDRDLGAFCLELMRQMALWASFNPSIASASPWRLHCQA